MPFEKASFHPKAAMSPPVNGAAGQARGYGAGIAVAPGGVRLLTMRGGLILGFGVLLILLILSGLSALHALSELQASNETTLQQFLAKNQHGRDSDGGIPLRNLHPRLPSGVRPRQSGTEPEGSDRRQFANRILLADNGPLSGPDDREMFEALKREIQDYWQTLAPVLSWNLAQRRREGYGFLRDEVFPRRSSTLGIADTIRSVNRQDLMRRDAQLLAKFSSVRSQLMLSLVVILLFGMGQALFSTAHLLRLERQTLKHLQEVTEARQELKNLSAKLVSTQENERKSISRDLHDAVGQSMSAVQFELHDLAVALRPHDAQLRQRVDRIRELVEDSLAVIRNMALLLRPSMLDDLGLEAALEWLAREISRPAGVRIQVRADGLPSELPDEHKTCIFRIAQEALNNVCKHANANSVEIGVRATESWLVITVQDDGRGFQHGRANGLGLTGMHERVESLGGWIKIASELGKGTLIEAALPLPQRLPSSARAAAETDARSSTPM